MGFTIYFCVPFFLWGKSCARSEMAKKLELDCVWVVLTIDPFSSFFSVRAGQMTKPRGGERTVATGQQKLEREVGGRRDPNPN